MGITFRELIEKHGGGMRGGWDNLLAVIPGGASVPWSRPSRCDRRADGFRRPARAKSGLGTAAVIVMDKSTDIVKAIARLSLLLQARELRPVHAVPRGHRLDVAGDGAHGPGEAQKREIDMLLEVTKQIEGHTICALGDAAAWPIQGLIRNFRPEIEAPHRPVRATRAAGAAAADDRCRDAPGGGVRTTKATIADRA